jgi:hypothetical protein
LLSCESAQRIAHEALLLTQQHRLNPYAPARAAPAKRLVHD